MSLIGTLIFLIYYLYYVTISESEIYCYLCVDSNKIVIFYTNNNIKI